MEEVREKVVTDQYDSEYAFQDDFYKSVFGPAHDSHMVVYPDALSRAFQWQRQRSLVSVSENGTSLPVIKVYEDVIASPSTASEVTHINGQDAVEYLEDIIYQATWSRDPDAAYNSMFYSSAYSAAGLGSGYFQGRGRLRYIYQGPSTNITFANGTTITFENQALVKGNMTDVFDGPSFYSKFCTPLAPDDTSAATQLVTDDSENPSANQPVGSGYPEPARASADGVISGYYLDGEGFEDVAVLSVLSFDPSSATEFQSVMDEFFKEAKAAGKTKLIVDFQANAGGFAILPYEVFGQLFPQKQPQDNGRWRKNVGFDTIARVYSQAVEGVDLTTSPNDDVITAAQTWFNWQNDLNTTDQPFQSFDDKFDAHVFANTSYTSLMRWNLSDPLATSNSTYGIGIEISGHGTRANMEPPFAPENIIILQDGTCMSSCSTAAELLRARGGIKSIAIGGRPTGGEMQAIGGVMGPQAILFEDIRFYAQLALKFNPSDEDRAVLENYTELAFHRSTDGVVNARDAILAEHVEDGMPSQYVYRAADCRLYFTEEMVSDISAVWKAAASAAFNGVACLMEPKDVIPGVEVIVLGGEPLSRQVLELWADHANVIQGYGPAEEGVDSAVRQHVQKNDSPQDLGRAVGSSIWIVNPNNHNQLVPIGSEGELLIEGPIVARGYLADEAQTNKAFIWDPEWVQLTKVKSGRRFYKTGDLGYLGPDGSLHVVGRNDFQVKIRGQRIEIGEVEYNLATAGGNRVLAAFVAVGEDEGMEKDDGLVITSPQKLTDFSHSMRDTKKRMQQTLPPYMMPAVFLPLRKLPLSLSGKIERKLLWALAEGMAMEELSAFTGFALTDKETVAPSTDEEEVVCEAWKNILQVKHISMDDDFFFLGGDSAKAMHLVSYLRKQGFALTVADIIQNPALAQQAACLVANVELAQVGPFSLMVNLGSEGNRVRQIAAGACHVPESRIEDVYPVTEMQERFFVGTYLGSLANNWVQSARESHDHARQIVFKLPKAVNVCKLLEAWRSTAQRHSILRTRFMQYQDKVLQVVVDKDIPTVLYEVSLDEFLEKDRADCMSWGVPLIRASASKGATWFVLTISHVIYDGFSLSKLFEEFKRAYEDTVQDQPSIHFNHFIKHLSDADKTTAIEFWRRDFAGANVKPVVPQRLLECKRTTIEVTKEIVKLPGNLAPGSPSRAVILKVSAALFLVHRLDCADIIFDCHLSGRAGTLPGVSELVGPTLTSLPIRVRIGSDPNTRVRGILSQTQGS
ncbi:hypothetical protein ACHAQH_008274 [Verticillium albo-atrum]